MPHVHIAMKMRLIVTFYRYYGYVSNIITVLCAIEIILSGGTSDIGWMVVLKLASLPIFVFIAHEFKKHEYPYYKNLGISRNALWSYSILLDILIFAVVITIAKLCV